MAKYGMSFSFNAICIIQLANENVGLSLGDVYSRSFLAFNLVPISITQQQRPRAPVLIWFVQSCDLTVSLYLVITKHITCILLKANQLT
jgi:hypothetical protein